MTPTTLTKPLECELFLRTPNPGAGFPNAPQSAYTFDRIWIPGRPGDFAGIGRLVTYHPPLLHDHIDLPPGAALEDGTELSGQSLLVVGRLWTDFPASLLQIVVARAGRLIYHATPADAEGEADAPGHLCVTAH